MQNVLIDMQILSCLVEVLLIFLAPVEIGFHLHIHLNISDL